MGIRYRLPEGDGLALAARLFDAASNLDRLRAPAAEDAGPAKVPFGRLYAYATRPDQAPDALVEQALEEEPVLRADFLRLLEKTATHRLPRVAAASSGSLLGREGDGCRIRFERSRAEPSQTYVIIELLDKGAVPPATLFVCATDNRCRRFSLPVAQEGVIQILVEHESELLQGLLDIKSEVFLR